LVLCPCRRQLREESKQVEGELEESRIRSKEAEDRSAELESSLLVQQDAARRAADAIVRLKQQLASGSSDGGAAPAGDGEAAGAAAGEAAGTAADGGSADPDLEGLTTSDQEIQLLRRELSECKAALKKVRGNPVHAGG
jgi:hypothetical protein